MSGQADHRGALGGFEPRLVPREPRPGVQLSRWIDRRFGLVAIAPTVLAMLIVFGLPLLFSLFLSFRGWTIDQSLLGGSFVGLDNYTDLLTDPEFIASLVRTLVYTAVVVAIELGLGLGLALLLNAELPGIALFRTLLIVPMMMTPIVAALCWKLLLDPHNGIVNYLLGWPILWLGQPALAMVSVSVVNIWQHVPYVAVLLLAGLRSLPHEPAEAASIDGASRLQIFRHVTLPLLQNHILVALLLRTIFEFRSFENVYVMTSGGPANATQLLSIFTYVASFVRFDLSLGAAAAWLMLGISLVMCLMFIAALRRRDAS
jgi:multiple sugar transport system permease protein